jgi:ATP-binding cassette subfamily C protein LapB
MKNESYANCLMPLLDALNWQGSSRYLKEALPHFSEINSLNAFLEVLENLQFDFKKISFSGPKVDERLLPALLVTEHDEVIVLLKHVNGQFKLFNGCLNCQQIIEDKTLQDLFQKGTLYVFKSKEKIDNPVFEEGWFWKSVKKNKALFYSALFLSLILNCLMLSTPVFVMAIYDYVINSASYIMLSEFAIGITISLWGMLAIYKIRAEHLSLLGGRFNSAIGNQIMDQLLYLAPSYTETATVGAQIARIKDFDRLREFVSGPMLNVFFDLPFIFIGLSLVAYLGGSLVFIPLAAFLLFLLNSYLIAIKINHTVAESAKNFSSLQEFLLESIESLRVIKYTNCTHDWGQRYREASAKTNLVSIKLTLYDSINSTLSEFILMGTGIMILAVGAIKAMTGSLDIGQLLGIMMIVWRILAPMKSIVTSLPRLLQLTTSVRQIEKLMSLPSEATQIAQIKKGKITVRGDIDFMRVSMRYPNAYNPSLLGVTFSIEAGSFVAITGRNGSGKSTILKILLGLYPAQAGAILIDGQDIRQLNPIDLRASMGYLPQNPEIFFGTIESNLRLGNPIASEADLTRAAEKAGILDAILELPDQFKTKIYDQNRQNLSTSFAQSLCLARAYLRESPILILDEPGNTLDKIADEQLMKYLTSLKGEKTIIMVSHRPSHWRKADKIFLMDQGQLVLQGPPNEVIPKLQISF